MEKFSFKECPKCGYPGIDFKFQESGGGTPKIIVDGKLVDVKEDRFGDKLLREEYCPEHILKTCRKCEYSWKETTKDTKQ